MMMATEHDAIGYRIRAARGRLGISQERLSKMLSERGTEMSRPTVSQWEQGHCHPSLERIHDMAAVLDVTPSWLAFGQQTTLAEVSVIGEDDDPLVGKWEIPASWLRLCLSIYKSGAEHVRYAVPSSVKKIAESLPMRTVSGIRADAHAA